MSGYTREYYDRYRRFDNRRLSRFLIKNLKNLYNTSLLMANVSVDIGCGTGRLAYALKECSGKAIGVDVSLDALRIAREVNGGIFFVAGDGLNLPLKDNSCDLCVCINVLEHVKDFNVLLKEVRRIAALDARVVFMTRNKKWTRFSPPFLRDKTHVKEFTVRELTEAISGYFHITRVKPFSMFTSFSVFNPVLNALFKPEACVFAVKK